jgi:hypothetical protein
MGPRNAAGRFSIALRGGCGSPRGELDVFAEKFAVVGPYDDSSSQKERVA